ncbi:aspartate kinase [Cyanobacterium stanieri LEGE 03274]|uniref:aspartate kinase n=1 Tax=Cyanobacterium stanieri LEGE 03274 TaxID=1828756 RepID=A0ABR9V0F1_9CHRO|nr:aspartate kinase [Cyanobacterium stanieri]MBE9221352.1 aspartate kinase [Cyanobacterium stanieri LEGE 03274]
MALIVQKYGGSSVGSTERIKEVSKRICATVKEGNQVVVVVSAMGKTTDSLVKLAQEISSNPCRREMDMLLSTGEQVSISLLSMALQEMGQPAISLTGAQVGIVTEAHHSKARILEIKTERVNKHLAEGKVIVVAGFQGISNLQELEITTLGRGGSDTSAVALAVAIGADCCEIYTDVPGILTTDPRIVPEAQLLSEITSDEMLELASLGAKVLHPRAVEIARNFGMPLVVKSSWTDDLGTRVISPPNQGRSLIGLEITKAVDAVQFDSDQAKIALLRVADRPGVAAKLFGEIARQDVDVDLIIQSIHEGNSNDIAFTVVKGMLPHAEAVANAIAPILDENGTTDILVEQKIAKIAIAGAGMIGRPGIAAQMFRALADARVNIQMISTSEVKVSCIVNQDECDRAIASLCNTFNIDSSNITYSEEKTEQSHLVPVRGVALDKNQAQIAILYVPDIPGMAAKIFTTLAEENISVDMIIQSQRCRLVDGVPMRDIAFTVAQSDAHQAAEAINQLQDSLKFRQVAIDDNIAKVSIVGSGMVGHPGIAAQFFAALAQEKINISMITTSEIKISCVVSQEQGIQALKAVHKAFNLGGEVKADIPAVSWK